MTNKNTNVKNREEYELLDFEIRRSITKTLHKKEIDDYRLYTGEMYGKYGMFIDLTITNNKISEQKLIDSILKDYTFVTHSGGFQVEPTEEEKREKLKDRIKNRLICRSGNVEAIIIEDFYSLSDRIYYGFLAERQRYEIIHDFPVEIGRASCRERVSMWVVEVVWEERSDR